MIKYVFLMEKISKKEQKPKTQIRFTIKGGYA